MTRKKLQVREASIEELLGDPLADIHEHAEMNAYAMRIWDGQSPDLPLKDRVARIKAGLAAQGWVDTTGLRLPADGFEAYL